MMLHASIKVNIHIEKVNYINIPSLYSYNSCVAHKFFAFIDTIHICVRYNRSRN